VPAAGGEDRVARGLNLGPTRVANWQNLADDVGESVLFVVRELRGCARTVVLLHLLLGVVVSITAADIAAAVVVVLVVHEGHDLRGNRTVRSQGMIRSRSRRQHAHGVVPFICLPRITIREVT